MSGPGRPAPIDVGWTISKTLEVTRRNLGPLAMLAVVCVGIPNVLSDLVLAGAAGVGSSSLPFGSGQFAVQVLVLVAQSFLVAGTVQVVAADQQGRRTDAVAAFRGMLACLGPVFGLAILTSLGIGLGTVLLIVPGILLTLRWFVAIPVRVMEGPGVGRAMGRSASLMRGNYWRGFALVLLYVVGLLVISLVVGLIDPAAVDGAVTLADIAVETALLVAFSLVGAVGVSVVYLQLRMSDPGSVEDVATVFG